MEGGEGYIAVTSTHSTTTAWCANFTVDNLRIVDTNPLSQIKTPVQEVVKAPATSAKTEDGGCKSALGGVFGAGFAILTTGTTMTVVRVKKSKKETAEDYE